jgi:hypothetical protein
MSSNIITFTDSTGIKRTLDIFFDLSGNLYLNCGKYCYEVTITGSNTLELDTIDKDSLNEVNQESIVHGKIKYSSDPKSLKGKAVQKKLEDKELIENDSDYDENEDETVIDKYFNEDHAYYEDLDESKLNNDTDNGYFVFSSNGTDVPIKKITGILSLYETLVYSGDLESAFICFKTKIMNEPIIYRIIVYSSGYICLKVIGGIQTTYKFDSDNELTDMIKLIKV